VTRIDFDASSDTDGDLADLMRNELPHTRLRKPKLGHNHVTREIRTDGTCPACNEYLQRHGIPEEEQ
jgi:hypothetical protein